MLRLVVGLGNPGKEYQGTRHNIGQRVVEKLADSFKVQWKTWKGNQLAEVNNQQSAKKVFLFMPGTFMNLSGQAVQEFVHFYKLDLQAMIVLHDELDLSLGEIQKKLGGSAAGHKGVQSVIDQLGTTEFWRLRLGIGRPGQLSTNNYQLTSDKDDISDFVLGRFTAEEEPLVTEAVDQAVTLLVESLENKPLQHHA